MLALINTNLEEDAVFQPSGPPRPPFIARPLNLFPRLPPPPGLRTGRLQPPAAGAEEEEAARQTGRYQQGHSERDGPEVFQRLNTV